MDSNLRNLKDFLTLYNKVTELCFSRCVDSLNERNLTDHEDTCVNRCVNKFAQFNQNMMKVYVEVQTSINTNRMKELENLQKEQQQGGANTISASSALNQSTESTSNLTA